MLKILADKNIPFLKGVLDPYAEVEYLSPKDITSEKVRDADALLIRTRTRCDRELLQGSRIKFIATATIGHEHIDKEYCKSRDINWANAPGCNAGSVAQYVLSALLHLNHYEQVDLDRITLGIVGVGNVGTRVANIAEKLGINILLNDPPRQEKEELPHFVSLDRIAREADVISFHVPLEKSGLYPTWHMVGTEFLEKIREACVLINTSRGAVFNNRDLLEHIRYGNTKSCVLDVWEHEPGILQELLEKINIGTAHIAGYSTDGKANGTSMSVRALSEFFELPLNDWYPEKIPAPDDHLITLEGTEGDRWDMLYEIVRHSYDVLEDHKRLVRDPARFEYFRENYPLRREFHAYALRILQDVSGISQIASALGFELMHDQCF